MERQLLIGEARKCPHCKVLLSTEYWKKVLKTDWWCPKCSTGHLQSFKAIHVEVPLNREGETATMSMKKEPDGIEPRAVLGVSLKEEVTTQKLSVMRIDDRALRVLIKKALGVELPKEATIKVGGFGIDSDDPIEIIWAGAEVVTDLERTL